MQAEWRLAGNRALAPGTYIAGVLNVTPDSFYDGGRHEDRNAAIARGREILTQGADILDVGGESTRPFSDRVDCREELDRILPVIRAIHTEFPDRPISVDTYKAETARRALEAGAVVVNDVTACGMDPELTEVLVEHQPGYVLMHAQGRPEDMQKDPRYNDPVEDIAAYLDMELNRLVRRGLAESRIVIDPGIGFGKRLEDNLAILRNIERFYRLGRPVFIGQSNKSLWQKLLGLGPDQRQNATQVATALLAERGVSIHRVHEVDLTRQTLTIVRELGKPTQEAANV